MISQENEYLVHTVKDMLTGGAGWFDVSMAFCIGGSLHGSLKPISESLISFIHTAESSSAGRIANWVEIYRQEPIIFETGTGIEIMRVFVSDEVKRTTKNTENIALALCGEFYEKMFAQL